MSDRDKNIYFARLAEQGERYEDMIRYMKEVVKEGQLSNDERNLLSVAYKNSVSSRRAAWRTISAIQNKEEYKGSKYLELIKSYRKKIEEELENICFDVLALLNDSLIPNARVVDAKVFYLKMRGDYYRYLGEFLGGDKQQNVIHNALDSYEAACKEAENLKSTHPIRLSLVLNQSVFYYEIIGEVNIACKKAKAAFDNAIADLDGLEEDEYRDSATIMQLLRDNLTLWMSDMNDVQKEAPAVDQ